MIQTGLHFFPSYKKVKQLDGINSFGKEPV